MGLRFSPNTTSGGSLRFATNQPGLLSSVYTVDWGNIQNIPVLVEGPDSSTDNAVPRFDGLTGEQLQNSGVLIDDSNNLTPATTDGAGLGTSSLNWADLFLDSGAVINFDSGDITITHAANVLAFAGGTYTFAGAVTPAANDGSALGSASVSWADLFLASDGVINWNNGAVTITHNSGGDHLFFQSATGGYYFDAVTAPYVDDGSALGASANKWSDLFLASGAVINFNSGDVTITHSANALAFAGGTVSFDVAPTVGASAVYYTGGTDVSLADGGTGTSLADPGADRIMFWDDSDTAVDWLGLSGLTITGNTLTVDAATTSAAGKVELATDAEAIALSDTSRGLTPSNLAAVLATDVQTFTSTGANTWTKPSTGRFALVQIVGAAGGGARRSAGNGSGGGAGPYYERLFLLSALGATETVTIGAGGAVQTTDNTNGNDGGTTSFGAHMTIYGGRGGQQVAAGNAIAGGGSGAHYDTWADGSAFSVGLVSGLAPNAAIGVTLTQAYPCGSATGASAANAVQTIPVRAYLGGCGGSGHSSTGAASGVAGTSVYAGAGGAGNGAGAGGNGASPGGGGGSGTTQGGSGGNARVIVTVF